VRDERERRQPWSAASLARPTLSALQHKTWGYVGQAVPVFQRFAPRPRKRGNAPRTSARTSELLICYSRSATNHLSPLCVFVPLCELLLTSRPYCDFYRNSMAVNTQFSIATHIMASLGYASGEEVNSGLIAGSVNTSSSFVRRVLAKLSKAGLVKTAMGKGGACWLARPARQISLLEIYHAVGAPKAFAIHRYPVEKGCPVSCHIKSVLGRVLDESQQALEQRLRRINLAQLIAQLREN
jgi:Rrf2 family protein